MHAENSTSISRGALVTGMNVLPLKNSAIPVVVEQGIMHRVRNTDAVSAPAVDEATFSESILF